MLSEQLSHLNFNVNEFKRKSQYHEINFCGSRVRYRIELFFHGFSRDRSVMKLNSRLAMPQFKSFFFFHRASILLSQKLRRPFLRLRMVFLWLKCVVHVSQLIGVTAVRVFVSTARAILMLIPSHSCLKNQVKSFKHNFGR